MGFFDSLFGKKKEEKKPEEKRICPVCGNSFTGRGMNVHDGIICMDCWELVMDDFEMGRMDEDKEFYIAPIKAAVLAKKGEIASDKAAKAEKPSVMNASTRLMSWKKTVIPIKRWKIQR